MKRTFIIKQKNKLACFVLLLFFLLFTACVHIQLSGKGADCYQSGIRTIDVAPDDSKLVFTWCNEEGSYFATSGITGQDVTIIMKSADGGMYDRAIFNHDGGKIFFIERSSRDKSYFCSIDTDGNNYKRITSGEPGTENIQDIAFSPDGTRIYYINSAKFKSYSPIAARDPHDMDFYSMNPDGSDVRKITDLNSYGLSGVTLSRNERFLYHGAGIVHIPNGHNQKVFHLPVSPSAGFNGDELVWGSSHPLSKISKQRQMVLSCRRIIKSSEEADTEDWGYGLYLNDLIARQITSEIVWFPSYLECPTLLNREDVVLFIKYDAANAGANDTELWRVSLDGSDLERIDLALPRKKNQ
jgi:hypothetical protein